MPKTGFAIGSTPIDYLYENEGYDLEACKKECVESTECVAIEWYFDYQGCILYSEYGETLEDSNKDIYFYSKCSRPLHSTKFGAIFLDILTQN